MNTKLNDSLGEKKAKVVAKLSVWESNPAFTRKSLSDDRCTHPMSIPTEMYVQAISIGCNVEIDSLKRPYYCS